GVQFDGFTDGILSLRARDEFVRQWIEDYYLPTLSDWLRAHTGLSIQARWSIDVALERPVADRPSYPPVRPRTLSVPPVSVPPPDEPSGIRDTISVTASTAPPPPLRIHAVPAPMEALNPKSTFGNFVVGPSNQLAHAASM